MQEQQTLLDELAKRQKVELDTFKTQLLAQIGDAFNTYTELQHSALTSSLASVKHSIATNLTG
jgi:hypothetical protein